MDKNDISPSGGLKYRLQRFAEEMDRRDLEAAYAEAAMRNFEFIEEGLRATPPNQEERPWNAGTREMLRASIAPHVDQLASRIAPGWQTRDGRSGPDAVTDCIDAVSLELERLGVYAILDSAELQALALHVSSAGVRDWRFLPRQEADKLHQLAAGVILRFRNMLARDNSDGRVAAA